MRWFYDASGQLRYEHWAIRAGNWIGPFNLTSNHYEYLNLTNFEHSLSVVREVVRVHGDNPVVIGIEPGDYACPASYPYLYFHSGALLQ